MTAVLDAALVNYRGHQFETQAAAAYESLAAEPAAAADYQRELYALGGIRVDALKP